MYSSVAAIVVLVTLCIGHIHGAVTDDFKQKIKTIGGECAAETKGNPDSFSNAWNSNILPGNENDNCFLACMMKKYGIMATEFSLDKYFWVGPQEMFYADGKFDVGIMNTLNQQRWSEAGIIEKADKINADCIAEAKTDGNDDCALAHDLLECIIEKSKKAGISAPDDKYV